MRQATWVFLRQIAACRKQWWSSAGLQFVFGVLVGVFLGFAVIFDYETEITSITKPFPVNKLGFDDVTNGSSIPVQCVLFIHPNQKRKSQYVEALRDTFTRQCTPTIYISNSQEIRQHFREELNIAFVNTKKTQYHWVLYWKILEYLAELQKSEKPRWTVVGDEQTFFVMQNLREYLTAYDPEKPLVLGRISIIRSLLSYIFPLNSYTTIHPQAGIVFSSAALKRLASSTCLGWLSSSATERALVQCSKKMDVPLVDPIDHEGMHLFNSKDPTTLITSSNPILSEDKKQQARCCSDKVISFGSMNYREHRMVDFVTGRIKVFGLQDRSAG